MASTMIYLATILSLIAMVTPASVCPADHYHHNIYKACRECSTCTVEFYEVELKPCTPTEDTLCGCPHKTHRDADGHCRGALCVPCPKEGAVESKLGECYNTSDKCTSHGAVKATFRPKTFLKTVTDNLKTTDNTNAPLHNTTKQMDISPDTRKDECNSNSTNNCTGSDEIGNTETTTEVQSNKSTVPITNITGLTQKIVISIVMAVLFAFIFIMYLVKRRCLLSCKCCPDRYCVARTDDNQELLKFKSRHEGTTSDCDTTSTVQTDVLFTSGPPSDGYVPLARDEVLSSSFPLSNHEHGPPLTDDVPSSRCSLSADDVPSSRCSPSADDVSSSRCSPSTDDVPFSRCSPSADDVLSSRCSPSTDDVPSSRCSLSANDVPSSRCSPLTDDVLSSRCSPSADDVPSSRCSPSADDASSSRCSLSTNDVPSSRCSPSTDHVPSSRCSSSADDVPSSRCSSSTDDVSSAQECRIAEYNWSPNFLELDLKDMLSKFPLSKIIGLFCCVGEHFSDVVGKEASYDFPQAIENGEVTYTIRQLLDACRSHENFNEHLKEELINFNEWYVNFRHNVDRFYKK